jgi:hypothetical protein
MEAVTHVQVREDFQLELTFSTGETRIFDARPFTTGLGWSKPCTKSSYPDVENA